MLRPPGTCRCRLLVTHFLLQGQGATSTADAPPSTAAIGPDRLCAGAQQQQQQQRMCLLEVPAAATAPPQRLQVPQSVQAHPGQLTAGAASAQHTHQADAVRAVAAAAAERPADMPQELPALPVQLAGQSDAAHPSTPPTSLHQSPRRPLRSREPAVAYMYMLEPGLRSKSTFAFETTSETCFDCGSAHNSTGSVAPGDHRATASAGSGLPPGGFRFGLPTASQVCT